jgi:hypothetical protein
MPLATQLRGAPTAGKKCELSRSQTMTSPTGTSAHQPNHVRLQIARIPAGIAAKQVSDFLDPYG